MTRFAFVALAAVALAAVLYDPELDRLLACHDRAVGGPALRKVHRVEYELSIDEQGMSLRGRYRAVREGIAGRMRIDVYTGAERVFSEWWDGREAWQLPQDAATPVKAKAEGSDALRHGLEQPGHFWTLADMRRNGHALALEGRDTADGATYQVVKLTLADGFTTWYWLNPRTCHIERHRAFRAFHPGQDSTRKWIETVFDDFRISRGITRPYHDRSRDLAIDTTVATARILALRFDPPFNTDSLTAR
ncbi:MAG TPA: hypothetical protein VFM14_08705 [Gemmatimonadales bacterium]|nr:hypothetical protein [Gemmatimonadales bacterium]